MWACVPNEEKEVSFRQRIDISLVLILSNCKRARYFVDYICALLSHGDNYLTAVKYDLFFSDICLSNRCLPTKD
jgi:hypothetical protein